MSDNRKDLPSVNSPNFLEKVREAMGTYLGNRGDKLDRGVTLRDLVDSNIIQLSPGFLTGSGRIPVAGSGTAVANAYEIDLTPPPTPSGATVSAAISNIFIEHAAPTYTQGHGHARTIVYAATWTSGALPVFADAVKITEFTGTVFAHPSNPATTWHVWIKWQSKDGVLSTAPAGGTNGMVATTGQDVATLLTALTGQITQSQLFNTLGARIDLIDGASGLAGSVNARVLAETSARTSGDSANASSINTLSAQVNHATTGLPAAYAAVQTEASTRASADGTLFAQYTVKVDVNGYVAGYGLASTATNAAPTSAFAVRADQFYIASPSGPGVAPATPFVVQTTQTTINGVVVPVGVYMTDAFIQNGTITNAKIANLAVDNAKIADLSVSKLTAGAISTGDITSTGTTVVNGAAVPSWSINGSTGLASFNNVTVRGAVFASSGTFAGSLSAATGTFAGSLSAATGTFSGALSAATGSFTGALNVGNYNGYTWPASGGGAHISAGGLLLGRYDAGDPNSGYFEVRSNGDIFSPGMNIVSGVTTLKALNVVNTLNIAGNSVTVPSVDYRTSEVFGAGLGSPSTVGQVSVTLSQPGWVYAMFTAKQTYGSGVRDSVTTLYLPNGGVAVGGIAITTNIAVSAANYLSAGTHTALVQWAGNNDGVSISNANLFVMGVMR